MAAAELQISQAGLYATIAMLALVTAVALGVCGYATSTSNEEITRHEVDARIANDIVVNGNLTVQGTNTVNQDVAAGRDVLVVKGATCGTTEAVSSLQVGSSIVTGPDVVSFGKLSRFVTIESTNDLEFSLFSGPGAAEVILPSTASDFEVTGGDATLFSYVDGTSAIALLRLSPGIYSFSLSVEIAPSDTTIVDPADLFVNLAAFNDDVVA